jgi:hypothetical protein
MPKEVAMVEWLVPISLFWTLSALYLGGFAIHIEDRGALRQVVALLLMFVFYLVVFWAVRTGLGGAMPAIPAVIVASLVAGVLIPLLARVAFRAFGVRISGAAHAHG